MADLFSLAVQQAQGRRRQMLRTAFGPVIAAALADPSVIEVMLNPDGRLWIDRLGEGVSDTGERMAAADAALYEAKGCGRNGVVIHTADKCACA